MIKILRFIVNLIVFFIPHKTLRKKCRIILLNKVKVYNFEQKLIQKTLKKYLANTKADVKFDTKNIEDLPVWQLWFQGENEAPKLIKNCFESVNKYIINRKIIRLDINTIHNYVDIPEFIISKYKLGIIANAQFSDIIRICLLEKYGGTWIDATVLLTDSIDNLLANTPLFMFSVPDNSKFRRFHLASNWFIHTQPNNAIIKELKNSIFRYWENETQLIDYFLFHILLNLIIENNSNFKKFWLSCPQVNNIEPHLLHDNLLNNFSLKKLNSFKERTAVHKLNHHHKNIIKNTFLDKFIKEKEIFF